MRYLSLPEVLDLHERIIATSGGTRGIRDIRLLESAVNQPRVTFDQTDLYRDVVSKAAALCHSLIMNHPYSFPWSGPTLEKEFPKELIMDFKSSRPRNPHKDHNHDNNPPDGSNWENLCIYCHDNEHRRYLDYMEGESDNIIDEQAVPVTHKAFAGLADMLRDKNK